ncbi:hypothetical protein HZS_1748 [Henneguya salminicola]|nr:hypothetical protein HZS_1748 [Henneguya salminicola]
MIVDDQDYLLDIVDTAGQPEYSSLTDPWYSLGNAFLVIFAINDLNSFNQVPTFIEKIKESQKDHNAPIVIVGNKSDCFSRVSIEEINNMINEHRVGFIHTSAMAKQNINKLFQIVVKLMRDNNKTEIIKKKKRRCYIL